MGSSFFKVNLIWTGTISLTTPEISCHRWVISQLNKTGPVDSFVSLKKAIRFSCAGKWETISQISRAEGSARWRCRCVARTTSHILSGRHSQQRTLQHSGQLPPRQCIPRETWRQQLQRLQNSTHRHIVFHKQKAVTQCSEQKGKVLRIQTSLL